MNKKTENLGEEWQLPILEILLRDVANKEINYIIVEDVSRLGRNALDILTTIQTLKKQGCIRDFKI